MPVLDPADPVQGSIRRPGFLPANVDRLGKIPDPAQLSPGDLILFEKLKPTLFGRWIAKAQLAGGGASGDARWTHAAIYVGEGNVVEANLTGVEFGPMWKYLGDYRLRVRRIPALGDADKLRFCIQAMSSLRMRYSLWRAVVAGWTALFGFWNQSAVLSNSRGVVCSKLFSDTYTIVLRRIVVDGPLPAVTTPAHLSATTLLDDVAVRWLSITP